MEPMAPTAWRPPPAHPRSSGGPTHPSRSVVRYSAITVTCSESSGFSSIGSKSGEVDAFTLVAFAQGFLEIREQMALLRCA